MYRILIADDEEIERNGIRTLLKRYGYSLEVYEASDGEEALQINQEHAIDILLTDIKMPFMDGLELTRQILSDNPDILVVIFSGYGEFSHAQKAIAMGVTHYILKPVDVAELREVMDKVIKILDSRKSQRENRQKLQTIYQKYMLYEKSNFIHGLINGKEVPDLSHYLQFFHLEYITNGILTAGIYCKGADFYNITVFEELLKRTFSQKVDYSIIDSDQILLLIEYRKKSLILDQMHELQKALEHRTGNSVYIVMGNPVHHPGELQQAYRLTDELLDCRFFMENSTIISEPGSYIAEKDSDKSIDDLYNQTIELLRLRDYHGARRISDQLFSCLQNSKGYSQIYTKYMQTKLIGIMFESYSLYSDLNYQEIVDKLFSANSLQHLKEILDDIFTVIDKKNTLPDKDDVIETIIRLIAENYSQELSLESISQNVHLAPGYISHLFRQRTGQSFLQYLISFRMKKAAEYLRETDMKVNQIALKTGYPNASYFIRTFKNFYGCTPAQFREGNSPC